MCRAVSALLCQNSLLFAIRQFGNLFQFSWFSLIFRQIRNFLKLSLEIFWDLLLKFFRFSEIVVEFLISDTIQNIPSYFRNWPTRMVFQFHLKVINNYLVFFPISYLLLSSNFFLSVKNKCLFKSIIQYKKL